MPFDEGYCCLQRLGGLGPVLHYDFLAVLLLDGQVLVYLGVRTEPQHQAHDEADAYLSYNLEASGQSFLVVAEYLDVVVKTAEESEPQRGYYHQDDVDVAHAA